MRRTAVIGTCFAIACAAALAAADGRPPARKPRPGAAAWEALGPEGGSITDLALSPAGSSELYALSGLAGMSQVFRTTDGARTWQRRSSVEQTSFDIAVDPKDPNVLYVLTDTGVLKSLDKGAAWTSYAFGPGRFSAGGKLAVHPATSKTLFASGSVGSATGKSRMAFFKSVDGGKTWAAVKLGADSDAGSTTALALSPSNPSTLYAAGTASIGEAVLYRMYKSTNGGASWSSIGTDITDQVTALAVHPSDPNRLWAATSWGIYRSADGGRTWQRNEGFAFGNSLAVDPSNADVLYAGYDKKCYKSVDGGVNWTEYAGGLLGIGQSVVVTAPAVYIGSTGGVFKSVNGGETWTASHAGIQASIIPAVGVAPSAAGTIYIEVQANGFYRSLSSGTTWLRLPDFYRCDKVLRIAVHPTNPDKLYILAGG
jgi:photosystem II stability/assembly factor-like uncharacterized protein